MKHFSLIIYLLVSLSCVSQKKEVITKSTIKLEGRSTNIRDLIEIGGYYHTKDYPSFMGKMFFEDGTYVYFPFKLDNMNQIASENEIKANMSKFIHSWIENKQVRWGDDWGVYRTQNDTIIVYRYMKGSFWEVWSLSEERYKIVDRETIQRIYYRGILKADDSYYMMNGNTPWISEMPMNFIPVDSLPSSDSWLKEKKWIWRNESDWKAYMEKIKQKKKERKK